MYCIYLFDRIELSFTIYFHFLSEKMSYTIGVPVDALTRQIDISKVVAISYKHYIIRLHYRYTYR